MRLSRIFGMVGVIAFVAPVALPAADANLAARVQFVRSHCLDCHTGAEAEVGLDLATLGTDLQNPEVERRWVQIFDRVQAGEMPPPDAEQPVPAAAQVFLKQTGDWLRTHQTARHAEIGRVQARRLTRREVERSLHDLLAIDIPLADQLPEESRSAGFTTVANGQSMSHFQLERHLAVVGIALDEAFRRALSPPDHYERDFDARGVARTNPRRRCREPEMLDGQAVVWSSGLIFYGRLPATTAPESGWYRFRVTASSLKPPQSGGVWATVRTGLCVSSAPLLNPITAFEATTEPQTIEFEAWLPKRHMVEIRPGDNTLRKAGFRGGQVGVGEGGPQNVPGIAIDRLTMQRIHHGPGDDAVRQLLFGDLPVAADRATGGKDQMRHVVSTHPREDAQRLMVAFAERAFRHPVAADEIAAYIDMALQVLKDEGDLAAALRVGYRALLCSPRFLYFNETPGPLSDHAIATRLSYFLTGSTPDKELRQLADAGKLHDAATIRAQADRLLAGDGGRKFMQDFAAQWLELDQIDFTEPDRKLYPRFDSIVQSSMLDETHAFLATMLSQNQSVTNLIDADYTFLNSRLARFYDIPGVAGGELRRVALRPEDHRGGVLTQGAILKVTANGSNTSPVLRGVWVSERLLGEPIPPPPASTPAIEPDIRGAKTIREQLAKHKADASCAVCHVKIDPPGFALENFDPAGQWRDRYTQLVGGKRKAGGTIIDASFAMPDGREFKNIDGFRALVTENPRQLAKNVAEKLLVYGTGAPISFVDRASIEQVVSEAAKSNYGLRSLVLAAVTSPTFRNK